MAPRIIDTIKQDHRDLEAYYDKIVNSKDPDEQTRFQNQFTWELARHSHAEELIVYPAFEKYLREGHAMAEKDRGEHQAVKEELKRFQNTNVSNPQFIPIIKDLMDNLSQHIKEEETHDLIKLEEALSTEESESMSKQFGRMKALVPSRSHPSAPNKPPFETAVGLLTAPIDHIADFFRKFPDNTALDDSDDNKSGDTELVDISFFEGPLNIKWNHASEDQPTDDLQEATIDNPNKLGDGVVVGAELSVGPTLGGPQRAHSLPSRRKSKHASFDRTATVRQYGQQLAKKNNIIVSVKESPPTIDLSSLEGTGYPESGASGSLQSASSTTNVVQKSYFYPPDPEQPDWKPFPMSSIYIMMLILVSITLAVVQEYLCQRSIALEKEGTGLISYDRVSEIPTAEFFCWKYLPTIVMVSYGVLWQITDYEVKRLEPYYQLSQPTGNTAAKTINLDYISLWSYIVPYKSLRYRHWAVFVSSLGAVLATTVAPSLQNPSVAPILNPKCDPKGKCHGQHKFFVQIHPVWSRILTACLILVAVFALILLFQLRRKSGLLTDPKGIAGIASMATKSHILTDFTGMEEARHDEIHKRLKNRRYLLYKSTIWQGEYMRHAESDPYTEHKVESPHPVILRRNPGIAFIISLVIFLVLIPVITYTDVNVVVTKVPWLPTLITTIIKQLWSTLEFSVRMLEPFYVLSRGNARPELTLTLDYKGTPYGLLPFQAFFNRHYLVALLGLGSVLGDILTVTASSLYLKDETPRSFVVSSTLSIIITAFLIFSASLVLVQRRHAFLPREPSTIASILAFIFQSRMLDDFIGTERFSNSEMEAMLIAKNKRYGLGWFKGRDKKPHCAVDEEPMLSRYVHGVSYIRAQAPWEQDIGV
ncbi:conserved hypothetical protein [Paecilomyces variotii No. 5]|uniref:Hemerythrin-like domain-containing protein n=1 Tax=Byssochlamys spectabilis (strain No. 5 / NBRC 109023) TaxID=1356009 RepID=V5FXE7_BYSSN|nr:conserved hypothetical protein [Paecilomyces variotii No. 5]